jgi:hypothetical protein
MELTAHAGARPTHAEWQGQLVDLTGDNKDYLSLDSIGYGSAGGFKGVNCRHDWFPFVEGVSTRAYSDSDIKALNERKVDVDGQEISEYDATQQQRAMEREIRDLKRKMAGYDEAIKNANSDKLREDLETNFYEASQKRKALMNQYEQFVKQTGLPSDLVRSATPGYSRSLSGKSVWANRQAKTFDDLIGVKTPVGAKVAEVGIHSRARAMARGVSPQSAADALTNPLKTGKINNNPNSSNYRTQKFTGKEATVSINIDSGRVTTMWKTGSKTAAKLEKGGGSS